MTVPAGPASKAAAAAVSAGGRAVRGGQGLVACSGGGASIDRLATTPTEACVLLAGAVAIREARAAFLAAAGGRA